MCLDNIIGLSNRECECVGEIPENKSDSGFYIDDTFQANNVFKISEALSCDDDIWDVMTNARVNAITNFKIDLFAAMQAKNSRFIEWNGVLGKLDKAYKLSTVSSFDTLGIDIRGKDGYKAANITINSMGLKLNTAGTYIVSLFQSGVVDPLETWEIDTVANEESYLEKSITIPMYTKTGLPLKYSLRYEPNGAKPYLTQFYCCSGPDHWNDLVDLKGVGITGATTATKQKPMHGLFMSISIHCGNEWLCRDWDYETDPWARTMAKTIQMMGILDTYKYINSSSNVNQYTILMEPEHILGKMSSLVKQIGERMTWLSHNLPIPAKECWKCNQTINVGEIMV
jgi:hypothetical protein